MDSKPMNQNLGAAKVAKQDEFYTQYVDIQKEVEAYLEFDPNTFRGKVIYCNCDDPFESNFFKYFAANFNKLGLKKLVTTSYDGSPIAGAQLTFLEYDQGNGKGAKPKAIAVEIEEVKSVNGAPRRLVWKPTFTIVSGGRARWACGQVAQAACPHVHGAVSG